MERDELCRHTCVDCGKHKLPMVQVMYDHKWRCIMCSSKFTQKHLDKVDQNENSV